ncbi:MAG: tannase/feruloyl esterase family alpha/beta hydrolase [Acetobacteraceae bacterium]
MNRIPARWNGRFLFQGGGGLDGFVMPAIGLVPAGGSVALARGFAVVSSDGGHEGQGAAFAADQQARLDYAYAGARPPSIRRSCSVGRARAENA